MLQVTHKGFFRKMNDSVKYAYYDVEGFFVSNGELSEVEKCEEVAVRFTPIVWNFSLQGNCKRNSLTKTGSSVKN